MKPKIFVETSCVEGRYTGIGKTISILIEELIKLDYKVECVSPKILKKKPSFFYYNYFIPQYCKRHLSNKDIFLIPNNMGKFWRLPHVRTWVLMHDLIPLSRFGYSGIQKFLYKYKVKQINYAERIICISNYVKKDLCDKLNVDNCKVKVLYWPITVPKIPIVPKVLNQYLSIGTGEPRKYVEFLIIYWDIISPPNSKLLLYGGEWEKGVSHKKLQEIIDSVGMTDRINLLGRVSDEELSRLYASSHGFIYPSMEEGFGLPPLEALSQGCDIVLPKTPINYELYSTIAHFYSPDDVDELRAAIFLCSHLNSSKNIAYSQNFNIDSFNNNILRVFKV